MKFHHFPKLYYQHEHLKIFLLAIFIILAIVFIRTNYLQEKINLSRSSVFGVSFSPSYTQALGEDPKQLFQALLEDLKVKNFRMPAYWNEIEPTEGKFNFTDLDYYVAEAGKYQAKVILAIGYKLPRWPECRLPGWVNLDNEEVRQEKQLVMLKAIIAHFEKNPVVSAWQIENEPLLPFGICPAPDRKFLQKEVDFVRTQTQKPIIITDSGELRSWVTPMKLADYFGTTLYRTVVNEFLGSVSYPLQPWFYRLKGWVVKKVFAPHNQKMFITELQAEPWATEFIANVSVEEQIKVFPLKEFENNVSFARKVGFEEIYLWGAEWWYYIKTQGQPQYWEYAKKLF